MMIRATIARCAIVLVPVVCLTGCNTNQSVLFPHGTPADDVATLSWILFAGGAVILAVVIAAVGIAAGRSRPLRTTLARERTIIALGIAWPAATLTVLLGYGTFLTSGHGAGGAPATQIAVTAERWWWRVAYASYGQTIDTANEIRIPVGEPVEFVLTSADVIHSFWVPALGGKTDMIPGRTTRLRLTADRPGIYRGQCAEYCGGVHALMALTVIAMPREEFTAWLAREAGPAQASSTDVEAKGSDLFLASGCGTCHSVRGTAAVGRIGPDLTHLGSRRSVAIDTMPLSSDNIKLFLVEGQRIKPGNAMPEFRVLSGEQRDAIAAYLTGLR